MITVIIPGEPVGQGRGRAYRRGNSVVVVDPKKSRDWKQYAQSWFQEHFEEPLTGSLRVVINAYWEWPKSSWRKRDPRGVEYRPKLPDGDNVMKAVFDAGNGVAWLDDRQIVVATINKMYIQQGSPAQVVVMIEEISDDS